MEEPAGAVEPVADAALIVATRSGDTEAYAVLCRRHALAARILAEQAVSGWAAGDVADEAFSRVRTVIRGGGGPAEAFRPYLLTTVLRVQHFRQRASRTQGPPDELELRGAGEPFSDPAAAGQERPPLGQAFMALPERWIAVLWHTQIEQAPPAEVAPLLGLTPAGLAALTDQACEGLRRARVWLRTQAQDSGCRLVAPQLGYERTMLSRRQARQVSQHLRRCPDCELADAELADIGATLRTVVAPLYLGDAAAAYLSRLAGRAPRPAARIGSGQHWLVTATCAGVLAVAAIAGYALTAHSRPARGQHGTPAVAAAQPATSASASTSRLPLPSSSGRGPAPPLITGSGSARPSEGPSGPASSPPPSPDQPPAALTARVTISGGLHPRWLALITVQVSNSGPGTSADLTARITLPSGVSLAHGHEGVLQQLQASGLSAWPCSQSSGGAICQLGQVGAAGTTRGVILVAVTSSAACGGRVEAVVSSSEQPGTSRSTTTLACSSDQVQPR
jgi:DNA-directed RNA polymerase specialized sigma24 family protein